MTAIAALGDVDIDLLVTVDEYPRRGEESFARDSTIGLGGSAVNTASTLAYLGFDTAILAQVGDDDFGRRARSLLTDTGVDTGHLLVTDSSPTGMNVVVVTRDGERTMLGLRGANRYYPGARLEGFEWLHLSAYALIEEPQRSAARNALSEARDGGIPISVDVPSGVAHRLGRELADLLVGVSIVSVGREPLTRVVAATDPAAVLLGEGVEMVAVTNGAEPFVVHRGGESVTVRPPSVEVVDTTGAGDSFIAGLIAGTVWNLDLGPTATTAAALGAAATLTRGSGSESREHATIATVLDGWNTVEPAWLEAARSRLL